MQFDAAHDLWQLRISDGRTLTCRFVVLGIGLLSAEMARRTVAIAVRAGSDILGYVWAAGPLATGTVSDPEAAVATVEDAALEMQLAAQIRAKATEAAQTIFNTQV